MVQRKLSVVAGVVSVVGLLGLAATGCQRTYKGTLSGADLIRALARKKPTPPTTLRVSGEAVTVDDIESLPLPYLGRTIVLGEYLREVARQTPSLGRFEMVARAPVQLAVERRIWNVLLYQKAKSEAGADPKQVDEMLTKARNRTWREYVVEHGGSEAEALQVLKDEEGLTRDQYLDRQQRDILSGMHVESQARQDLPISHVELLDYYQRMRDEHFQVKAQVTLRLIDIQLARVTPGPPDRDRAAAALRLAQDLKRRLDNGEDFAALAKAHSHGHMARLGGLWKPRDPASFVAPYDRVAQRAMTLAVGQVSDPLVLGGHVFLVRLEDKQEGGYAPLEEVQPQVEAQIRQDRRAAVLAALEAEIAERAQVGQIDTFVQYVIEELYRRGRPG